MSIKNKSAMMAMATGCFGLLMSGVLLSGCKPREEIVVVQPPQKVVEKTTIKAAPQNPKKIVVKPAPAPKTKVETKVKVALAPTPIPSELPEPAPAATPKIAATPKPTPASTPRPMIAAKPKATPAPRPQPTATPKPKPTAAPRSSSAKNLVVRAEVVATSKVPDPKSVPYKESLVFTKYKVLSVESGKYREKEILVAQWGMKDKKILPAARKRVGQVQTLSLEPLSGDLESVMRNDDTEEYELKPYFAR